MELGDMLTIPTVPPNIGNFVKRKMASLARIDRVNKFKCYYRMVLSGPWRVRALQPCFMFPWLRNLTITLLPSFVTKTIKNEAKTLCNNIAYKTNVP